MSTMQRVQCASAIVIPLLHVVFFSASDLKRVSAQTDSIPTRDHIFLPPTRGATVLSTYIDAQARDVAAMGDFLESEAIARRHRAAAAEHEMQNAVLWVETYFKRRELNRAYRLKENPPYLDREVARDKVAARRIAESPGLVREGDVTDELNWLLDKLATTTLAYEYFYSSKGEFDDSKIDQRLSLGDIGHIVFTDGGRKYGHKLTFRADDPKLLHERWPLFLRAPAFNDCREEFEKTRDTALKEVEEKGELSYESWRALQHTVDRIAERLNQEYRKQGEPPSPQMFLMYNQGKRFLQSLALGIHCAATTNDLEVFRGSYRFAGDSMFELIRHVCLYGLQFSPPEAGDEPTYERLLIAMRQVYLHFHPDAYPANPGEP